MACPRIDGYRRAFALARVEAMASVPARRVPEPASGERSLRRTAARGRELAPGLAACAAASAAGSAVHAAVPSVTAFTAAVVLGVAAANLGALPAAVRPGIAWTGRRVMRAAVALLGLKLALGDVLALGWQSVLVVVAVVAVTFAGTRWLGARAGLPGDQPLLIATGFSICGASAVAAMSSATDSEEQDAVTAVALVTLCGSLAIAVLPLLHHPLGLTAAEFGRWTGASVHDVGQVVAVAQTAGPRALTQAVVVKLVRVALLAPLVSGVTLARRGTAAGRRTPVVPLFLLGFLACAAARSSGTLPSAVLAGGQQVGDALMAAALFALGSTADLRTLLRTGRRATGVGLASWLLIAAVSYAGVRVLG